MCMNIHKNTYIHVCVCGVCVCVTHTHTTHTHMHKHILWGYRWIRAHLVESSVFIKSLWILLTIAVDYIFQDGMQEDTPSFRFL